MKAVLILIIFSLISSQSYAQTNDLAVHFAEHVGISAAISLGVTEVLYQKFGASKLESFLFGLVVTNIIGIAYKFTEIMPNDPQWTGTFKRAILFNNIGIGLTGAAVFTIPGL